jgi:hypothetical protein
VGSAALGREAARDACVRAAERVKDALGKLKAAETALEPKMPYNRAGRAKVSDA